MDPMEYLNHLLGKPLCYGIKSPDTDLYDFGFGDSNAAYILHAICRFKIIRQTGAHTIRTYREDTPCDLFHSQIQQLFGSQVNRIALSDKNDLWLDFGDYWMVFATFENPEESWRFFSTDTKMPHLVASASGIYVF